MSIASKPAPGSSPNLLVASSPGFYNYVGEAVAMDGDTIVASAPGIAAAYLFTLSPSGPFTQTETTKLVPQTGSAPNYAVRAIAIHGDVISLGSGQSGAAYLFERNQGGANAWGRNRRLRLNLVATSAPPSLSTVTSGP